jgi:hypothetical protein
VFGLTAKATTEPNTIINIKPTSTKSTFYKTIFFKPQPQKLAQYQTHYNHPPSYLLNNMWLQVLREKPI